MDNNNLISMMITAIVALIVTGAVMIPICDSISQGSGSDNGGGSRGEEIVNDLSDIYSQVGVVVPTDYHSVQSYHYFGITYYMDVQESCNYVMTKQDLLDIYESEIYLSEDGQMGGDFIIFDVSISGGEGPERSRSGGGRLTMYAMPEDVNNGHPYWMTVGAGSWSITWAQVENIAEFELDFSNGHIRMVSVDNEVVDTTVEYAMAISKQTSGYIDLGLFIDVDVSIEEGVEFGGFGNLGYEKDGVEYSAREFPFDENDFDISPDMLTLKSVPADVSDLASANVCISGEDGRYGVDADFTITDADTSLNDVRGSYYLCYVSTAVGESGGSSDNGIINTIIMIIPIFVILGILMFMIQSLRQNGYMGGKI